MLQLDDDEPTSSALLAELKAPVPARFAVEAWQNSVRSEGTLKGSLSKGERGEGADRTPLHQTLVPFACTHTHRQKN